MVKTNLAAWTPNENHPPYLSINYVDSNGTVEITMRERATGGKDFGDTTSVKLTQGEFQDILNQLKKSIHKPSGDLLLDAVQKAYRKHHMSDDGIGWDELGNILQNALCNTMGDDGFNKWINSEAADEQE